MSRSLRRRLERLERPTRARIRTRTTAADRRAARDHAAVTRMHQERQVRWFAFLEAMHARGFGPQGRRIGGGRELTSARCPAVFAFTIPRDVFLAWGERGELPDPVRYPLHHKAAQDPDAPTPGEWRDLMLMPRLWELR
jgi:hypothetical protein